MKRLAARALGRAAPSALRWLAHRNPVKRGRWPLLDALNCDPQCRSWLAGLENPTWTRRGFRLFTIPGDLTSDFIKLHGQHEAGTEEFILDHLEPGSTFLDIGANIGYFSLLAAIAGGAKCVAFEPQGPVADLLARSAELNGVSGSVRVERLALSDAPASMRMTSCPGNTGHAQLAGPGGEGAQERLVPVVALDEWLRSNPVGRVSVCKIDTEGTELRVLRGMPDLLARDAPAMVIEVIDDFLGQYGSSGPQVLDLLGSIGYRDVSGGYTSKGDCNRYLVRERRA
jgi:FkbM family methyltransferase